MCLQEVLEGGCLTAWNGLRTVCIGCIRGANRRAVGNYLNGRVFRVRVIVREAYDHHDVEVEAEHVRADRRNGHLMDRWCGNDLRLYGRRGYIIHDFLKSPWDGIEQKRPGH